MTPTDAALPAVASTSVRSLPAMDTASAAATPSSAPVPAHGESPATSAVPGSKGLRADAQRNRDALLEAAAAAFTENGTEASLEDIAKRAGVGIGTLYRHFPSRGALVEAAYRRGVERICDDATELLATQPPVVALEQWMESFVGYVATKRGLAATLKQGSDKNTELFAYVHARMHASMKELVDAAVAAGEIRSDVSPVDLMRAVSGVCMASDSTDWQAQARRLVALLVDGLRYGASPRR
jgi:AcrR family transcriptional regulator